MRRTALVAALLCAPAACASPRAPAEPTFVSRDPVARGTTREDLLFRYGVPTATLDGQRVLCWRLRNGEPVFPEHRPNHPEYASWLHPTTSLVVILGPDGRAERSAEVWVGRP
ncbi:MAG: hypothetical protein K8T90_02890 [Planctomycetes bacterium]|nr:hypothetical protein [Planctomycetota bacterium]